MSLAVRAICEKKLYPTPHPRVATVRTLLMVCSAHCTPWTAPTGGEEQPFEAA